MNEVPTHEPQTPEAPGFSLQAVGSGILQAIHALLDVDNWNLVGNTLRNFMDRRRKEMHRIEREERRNGEYHP